VNPHISYSPDGKVSWLHVPDLDFVGDYAVSPNTNFILGWGHRKYEYKILLVADGTLAWWKPIRPCWRGKVADNGTSAIVYEPTSQELNRVVFVIDRHGRPELEQTFGVAIYSLVLSDDGSLLCFNTGKAGDSDEAESLFIYWIAENAKLLFKASFDGAEVAKIRFEGDSFIITADGFDFVYTSAGELQNGLEVDYHYARRADAENEIKQLYRLADRRVRRAAGHLNPEDKEFVKWALASALRGPKADAKCAAKAARLLGELALADGETAAARKLLERALALDSACGAKKLLNRIS
jgi:hypothetical protein